MIMRLRAATVPAETDKIGVAQRGEGFAVRNRGIFLTKKGDHVAAFGASLSAYCDQ